MTALVTATDLKRSYEMKQGWFRARAHLQAVGGVSFALEAGKTLAIVGESGCGKSTLARLVTLIEKPSAGTLILDGVDAVNPSASASKTLRRAVQIVFQNPYGSLNPRKRVGAVIADPMRIHRWGSREQIKRRVGELLELVGLSPEHVNRYPHEFSGGQRQRIGVARALALHPRLIIADEPVSALDVSIRAQVINLLDDLQDELSLTYIFIAHDLGVVRHVSDRIAVMYLGKIVEISPAEELYKRPIHPYTEALLSAVPIPDPDLSEQRAQIVLEGDVPSPIAPPSGCRFHTRCRYATEICSQQEPPLVEYGNQGHAAACHHPLNADRALAEESPVPLSKRVRCSPVTASQLPLACMDRPGIPAHRH